MMADEETPSTAENQTAPESPKKQEPAQRPQHGNRPQHQRGQSGDNQRQDNRQRFAQQRNQPHQQTYDISVVIPLFNEEDSLKELHQQLRQVLGRMNVRYELIFVDDGSTDRSFQNLRDLKRNDHHMKIVRFRRNYGKSAALAVGFEKAQGNIVITMDADLQDDPAEIPSLRKKIEDGYDLVSGWKKIRRDPITKTIPSKFFNFVTRVLTGIRLHDFNCGLKAYRKEVIKTVQVYGELHRYMPVLAHWEGFRIGELVVQHRARKYGKTKFGLGRFWKGFLDLLTALFTTRYLRRPMHLFGFWGIIAMSIGIAIDGWLSVEWFLGKTSLTNRPLFLAGFVIIIVGIQFMSIGLLGEMISKTRGNNEEYAVRDYIR